MRKAATKVVPLWTDRFHPHDRIADQRAAYSRDRDRVLYSQAFRRLAEVTQVVHASEGDVFHNRLTHSMKVAQVARRLAEFTREQFQDTAKKLGGPDPEVAEAAALAHDLGHPPFGHIAEAELDALLREKKIVEGFEGNAQSFRIVTQLADRNTTHRGLNLTRRTLAAILKYPWGYREKRKLPKSSKKWGYYSTEAADFRFARELLPRDSIERTVEAELMDWADDITYSVHDVEDFYRAGVLPFDQVVVGGPERERFLAYLTETKDSDATPQAAEKLFTQLFEMVRTAIRYPYTGARAQRIALDQLRSQLIFRFVRAIELRDADVTVAIDPICRGEVEVLKSLMRYYVFDNPSLVAQQIGQRNVVRELFATFYDSVEGGDSKGFVPAPFRDALDDINNGKFTEDERRLRRGRLAADIVASLTEAQAVRLHRRICGFELGSVRDMIVW